MRASSSKRPEEALRLLHSKIELSTKQRKLLAQHTPIKRAAAASSGVSNASSARQVVELLVATGAIQRPDIRASPRYHELWRMSGMPQEWPVPFPYHTGESGVHKTINVQAQTGTTTVSLAAGEYMYIGSYPKVREQPIRCQSTTGGGAVGIANTLTDWSLAGRLIDRDVTWTASAAYAGDIPCSYTENEQSVKTAPRYVVKPTTANDLPVLGQCLGGVSEITVQCPTNALARVYVVDSHTSKHSNNVSSSVEGGTALIAGNIQNFRNMHGRFHHLTALEAAQTPVSVAQEYGAAHLLSSGETGTYHMYENAERGWTYFGELDYTDSVADSSTSYLYNLDPRNNYAKPVFSIVYNPSATAISVTFKAKYVFAIVLETDDTNKTMSSLQNALAKSAPSLGRCTEKEHLPTATASFNSSVDTQSVKTHVGNVLANHGLPPVTIRSAVTALTQKIETGIRSATQDVSSALQWTKNNLPGLASAARTIATDAKSAFSAVEEFGAGLLALF